MHLNIVKTIFFLIMIHVGLSNSVFSMIKNENGDFDIVCATEMINKTGKRVILYAETHKFDSNTEPDDYIVNKIAKFDSSTGKNVLILTEYMDEPVVTELRNILYGNKLNFCVRLGCKLKDSKYKGITCKGVDRRVLFTNLYFISILKNIGAKNINVPEKLLTISMNKVFNEALEIINDYINKADYASVICFELMRKKIHTNMGFLNKLDMEKPFLSLGKSKINDILTSHSHILNELVDSYALSEIINADPKSTIAFFGGTAHTSDLREYLLLLGFTILQRIDWRENDGLNVTVFNWITDNEEKTCSYCLGAEAKFRCSKCKYTRYCSIECQRKAWPNKHKEYCGKALSMHINI